MNPLARGCLAALLPALLLGAALALPAPLQAESDLGAFFTQVNTYVHSNGPNAGPRYLVRPRQTFAVIDLHATGDGTVWYQILYPAKDQRVEGVGWILEAPHEILDKQGSRVTVFAEIPDKRMESAVTVTVATQALKMLNVAEPSADYPEVSWYKVQYSSKAPLTPWIRAATGIYRPGVSEEFLTRVYATMVARNIPFEKIHRLLSGVIVVGDSQRDVAWGLGDPLHVREENVGDVHRVYWQYGMVVVQFDNDVVKQIN